MDLNGKASAAFLLADPGFPNDRAFRCWQLLDPDFACLRLALILDHQGFHYITWEDTRYVGHIHPDFHSWN